MLIADSEVDVEGHSLTVTEGRGYNGGSYTLDQQIFCISWSTILSFNLTGNARQIAQKAGAALQRVFNDGRIRKLIGEWRVVWGPAVFAGSYVGPKKELNTMFMVSPASDPSHVVIAISGTNGSSLMDWVVEDFDVSHTVRWPYNELGGRLARGTAFGLSKLVKMRGLLAEGEGSQRASDFLANGGFTQVTVAGHSLGGALAPCFSLYLHEIRAEWDPGEAASIRCLPTGGPTAGDATFSAYYDERLGANTTRVWNSLDIVPHAFDPVTLNRIPGLYEPRISSRLVVKIVDWCVHKTQMQSYLNIAPATPGFPSHFYRLDDFPVRQRKSAMKITQLAKTLRQSMAPAFGHVVDAVGFIIQALIQHTIGYIVYFGIEEFDERMTAVSKQNVAPLSEPISLARRVLTLLNPPWEDFIFLQLKRTPKTALRQFSEGHGPALDAVLEKVDTINEKREAHKSQKVIFLIENKA